MPAYRIPVLVVEDHQGLFTAVPVEGDLLRDAVAVGRTAAKALEEVQQFLVRQFRHESLSGEPDLDDPQLIQVRVAIRPQYTANERVFPCQEEIHLRVPCVHGRQRTGTTVCWFPTLGLGFYVFDPANLRQLAGEKLRQRLEGSSPRDLVRLLSPKSVRLDRVIVRVPPRKAQPQLADLLPTLSSVAQPLGEARFRKRFSPAYQREAQADALARRLSGDKSSLVLVGERGVGKSALLVAAVRSVEVRKKQEDESSERTLLYRHRFWQTSAARIVAGMKYLGQWEQRCEAIVDELSRIDGVLCVESLLDLVLLGGIDAANSIAAFFLPYLRAGELRMAAEATANELDACRRHLPGFADVFQVLPVDELRDTEARLALTQCAAARTQETRIACDAQVPAVLQRLFRRFLPYRPLPGGAAGMLGSLFDQAAQSRRDEVTVGDVMRQFRDETGLPDHLVLDDQPLADGEPEPTLRRQILGQPAACQAAARAVATFKSGLNDPGRPVATLLFCGPTGVGKTELAKSLARYLFGHGKDADRLVRLDMSEYGTPWTAQRLIVKDDRTPSDFIARVRRQPFVVVLLDEIEKAAAEVFDILLGVLDEGRLTDPYGRTTDFRSAILIMTSNLGSSHRRSIGFGGERADNYDTEVQAFFRPEFYNRIDQVVTFQPLDLETCRAITRKELSDLASRPGLARPGLRVSASDALVAHLTEAGFDPRYGARPLQRVIEHRVVAPLARHLVSHPALSEAEIRLDLDPEGVVCVVSRSGP